VALTQGDIRQLQLAKAAIRAAVTLLLEKTGTPESAIERVLLAGAFGNCLRGQSAIRIGLLPSIDVEKIRFVGNAALCGAEMMLLDRPKRAEARRLACGIKYLEIAREKAFQEVFAASIPF
jgi:uncharacterized 2Fe-2S/4Fe-4S cluster protein (DUF4445 family)